MPESACEVSIKLMGVTSIVCFAQPMAEVVGMGTCRGWMGFFVGTWIGF